MQYSEVRKGPRYVPKSRSQSHTPPPGGLPPESRTPRSPGGVAELDSLLEMLNDTQISIQGERITITLYSGKLSREKTCKFCGSGTICEGFLLKF